MIVVQHSSGRGIQGLVDYVMHDKAQAGSDEHPTTSERVLWADSLGLLGIEPERMMRIMQGVTADQKLTKQRAGTSNRGRKLKDPYVHFSMNYGPGPRPSQEEVMGDSRSMVAALGMADNYYFIVVGHDDPHNSYHVIGCRIDPESGKAAKLSYAGLKLSAWAEEWEREHGGIRVLNRVKRRKVREHNTRVRQQCKNEGRELEPGELRPEPPLAPRRGRDHRGRSVRRTEHENREFTELQNRHGEEKTPEDQRRAKRFELQVRHVEARGEKVMGNRPIEQPAVPEPVDVPRQPDRPEPTMDFELSVQVPPPVEIPRRPQQPEPVLESMPVQVPPPVEIPRRPQQPEPVLESTPVQVPPPVEIPRRPQQPEPVLESTPVQVPPVVVPVRPRQPEPVENRRRREALEREEQERRQAREADARRQRQEHAEARRRMLDGLEKGWGESAAETRETAETLVTEFPDLAGRWGWGHLSERQRHQVNTDEAGRYGHIEFVDDDKKYFSFGAARRELEQHVIGIAAEKAPEGRPTAAPGFKDLLPRALVRLQELVDGIIARALGREQPKPTAAPEASPPSSSREPAAGAAGVESRGPTPPQPASPPPDRATERQPRPLTEPAVVRRAGDPAGGRPLRPAAPGPPPRSKGRGGPG